MVTHNFVYNQQKSTLIVLDTKYQRSYNSNYAVAITVTLVLSITMDINTPICHRKHLVKELQIDKNNITSLTINSEAFKNLVKELGYATRYNFGDVLLLSIGNELLELNMPFRAVNILLIEIAKNHLKDMAKEAIGHEDDKSVLLVGKNSGNGIVPPGKVLIETERKSRIGGMFVTITNQAKYSKAIEAEQIGITSLIVIKLWQIIGDIFRLSSYTHGHDRVFMAGLSEAGGNR